MEKKGFGCNCNNPLIIWYFNYHICFQGEKKEDTQNSQDAQDWEVEHAFEYAGLQSGK
jgi:hypothetical protein